MAPTPPSRQPEPASRPNTAFRRIRGDLSPGEFSAAVRRAAREIGERVSCDARYIGRVESGEIRCPNYAYERVFKHMFPGYSLGELGFAPREAVRGRNASRARSAGTGPTGRDGPGPPDEDGPADGRRPRRSSGPAPDGREGRHLPRRVFPTGGPAAFPGPFPGPFPPPAGRRVGGAEARSVEEAVRRIRVLDDRHGADGLYLRAGHLLRDAHALLDQGTYSRPVADRLYAASGELALSVGWLAHDSGRPAAARAYYAEALATARAAGDQALEAHAFCNASFLARDDDRPREAVRAAQAARQAAGRLGSWRLLSLLALREAGGWAGLGDRAACEQALLRAQTLFARGAAERDPEWMSFYGEAEMAGLEAQCRSRLGDHRGAAARARRGVLLQDPHFTRNIALYSAQLAADLAAGREPDEAAEAAGRSLDLLDDRVRSARIHSMLASAAHALAPFADRSGVAGFLRRHEVARAARSGPEEPGGTDAGGAGGPRDPGGSGERLADRPA